MFEDVESEQGCEGLQGQKHTGEGNPERKPREGSIFPQGAIDPDLSSRKPGRLGRAGDRLGATAGESA